VLVADAGAPDDPPTYQFENALWIGFHGGYGMFVDNLEARLPTNTDERWLRNSDRIGDFGMFDDYTLDADGRPIDDPDWQPRYREERVLPGQPDYETVICHDCAHELCEREPWLKELLRPYGSHAHRTAYHEAHPEHRGWDYDPDRTPT
jgi:hypothetical protein